MRDQTPDEFRQADALFEAVLDLPSDQQDAFLERSASGDPALLASVRQLLAAHRASGSFLEQAAEPDAAAKLRETWDATPALPSRVGPFRVVREIGRGGMGTVYLAERDDAQFEQRVALKIVRGVGADDALVRRFRDERRLLARLEHRHISRLLDGGVSDDGTPWFAMEFVEGARIDRWCDDRALPIEPRLKLFESACEAVQYAHRQFVVHRDIKPSNILVTNDGELKLLDFGIAKALSSDAGVETTQTLLAMTPQYAAPEQVRGEPVSAATDVYSLGVLLYELLTGTRPYDVSQRTPAEIERIVSDVEPPRPSVTITGGDAAERARVRATVPERLQRQLRGDLDAIVMKAMRKDPARRYQSATELLDDLRRQREGHAVLARPESTAYRARRFAGRHRAALAAGSVFTILLIGGFFRERTLRQRAESETRKAQAVEEYMVSVFNVANPFAATPASGEDVTARALLDRGAERVESELASQPDVQSEMRVALGRTYSNLGLYTQAEALARKALEQRRALYGDRHIEVALSQAQLGNALSRLNRFEEADTLLRESVAQLRTLAGPGDARTWGALETLASLTQQRGKLAEADTMLREVLARRRVVARNTADSIDLAGTISGLGVLLFVRGEYEESEAVQREAVALRTRLNGENHPSTSQTMSSLAQVLQMRGQLDEAEALFRRALDAKRKSLGDLHPSVTISMNNFGSFLVNNRGKVKEADSLFRMAVSLDRQLFGDKHGYVSAGLNNLSATARARGDWAGAARYGREAVGIAREVFPGANKETAAYLSGLGSSLLGAGDVDGASAAFRDSYEMYIEALGETHMFTQTLAVNLARVQKDRGEVAEAERLFRGVLTALDSTRESNRTVRGAAQLGVGQIMVTRGNGREAVPLLEQAVAAFLKAAGENHARTAEARLALGMALTQSGQPDKAAPLLQLALEKLEPQGAAQAKLLASARRALDDARRFAASQTR